MGGKDVSIRLLDDESKRAGEQYRDDGDDREYDSDRDDAAANPYYRSPHAAPVGSPSSPGGEQVQGLAFMRRQSSSPRYVVPLLATLVVALAAAVVGLLARPPGAGAAGAGGSRCDPYIRFDCGGCIPSNNATPAAADWRFDPARDDRDYGLTHDQCEAAFPGLFADIDLAVRRHANAGPAGRVSARTFDEAKLRDGTMRAMVYDGELFLMDFVNMPDDEELYYRLRASLHDLNRALAAAPTRMPNVEFIMHDADFLDPELFPDGPYWTYTRKPEWNNSWLMPDFGFYSWPQPRIGTFQEVRRKMSIVDQDYASLQDKLPQMFWRGNVHMAEDLRNDLIHAAEGKSWADVKPIEWGDRDNINQNYLPIEEHCRYSMLMHTEGRSYSGRLKYLQNCRSLVFAHKLQWIQPFEYLMVAEGENQNFVEVERDFSDLDKKVRHYMDHPEEAQRVADNGYRTFQQRYLTPAANSCYWRRLLTSWAEVSEPAELIRADGSWRGSPFESIGLMNQMYWDPR